jgi:hypothetical protein
MVVDGPIFKDVVRAAHALRHRSSVRSPRISLPRDTSSGVKKAGDFINQRRASEPQWGAILRKPRASLESVVKRCTSGGQKLGRKRYHRKMGKMGNLIPSHSRRRSCFPETSTTGSVVIGKFRASCLPPRLGIFLPGGLENLFQAQKRTYWL